MQASFLREHQTCKAAALKIFCFSFRALLRRQPQLPLLPPSLQQGRPICNKLIGKGEQFFFLFSKKGRKNREEQDVAHLTQSVIYGHFEDGDKPNADLATKVDSPDCIVLIQLISLFSLFLSIHLSVRCSK